MLIFYYPKSRTNTGLPTVTFSPLTKNFKEKETEGDEIVESLSKG